MSGFGVVRSRLWRKGAVRWRDLCEKHDYMPSISTVMACHGLKPSQIGFGVTLHDGQSVTLTRGKEKVPKSTWPCRCRMTAHSRCSGPSTDSSPSQQRSQRRSETLVGQGCGTSGVKNVAKCPIT